MNKYVILTIVTIVIGLVFFLITICCFGLSFSVSLFFSGTLCTLLEGYILILGYIKEGEKRELEEQRQRFSKFKEGIFILNSLVKPVSNLFNQASITLLANRLSIKLLGDSENNASYLCLIDLLRHENRTRLETVINTVLEENETVKKHKEYCDKITNTLKTNIALFPDYQILLFTLFDPLLFYNSNKASRKKILELLDDEFIRKKIIKAITVSSNIDITIRLSTTLATYIRLIPEIDNEHRQIKITEDMLEDIADMIDWLLFAYSTSDDILQKRYEILQKKTIPDTESDNFIVNCDTYLPLVVDDLDSEIKEHLFELYNRIKEMLERNEYVINFPQGF